MNGDQDDTRPFPDLPELPSDKDLGIDGLDEEELLREYGEGEGAGGPASSVSAPPPPRPPKAPPAPPPRMPGRDAKKEGTPGGPGWILGIATLVVLLFSAWMSTADRILPRTVAANAPDTAFASARAMAHLVELARAPRPVGSPEHDRARELIVGWLRDVGVESEIHTAVSLRRVGETARAVTVRNIVARIPGSSSTGAIVLASHYDGVPISHGAGDAGVGVVSIIEAVRALRVGPPLENDVIVLITDAEEIGLLGARAFIEEHRWMDDIRVVLSAEMRGGGGPAYMFETGAENGWIVGVMRAADPRPASGSFSVEAYRRLPNDTDFTPFREAGIQGLNFAGIDRSFVYHQATDVPANIDERTIQHMGMRLLAITRELGGRDLTSVDAPDVVYLTLPVIGIIAYPRALAFPISTGIALLWGCVLVLAARRGSGWAGAGFGAVVILVAAGLTGLAGWGLMRWLPRFHPEFGTMTPAFYGEGWYLMGFVLLAVAILMALLGIVRRVAGGRADIAGLAAGALILPVLVALLLGALVPLTAIDLQIPALAGVLAAGVLVIAGGATPEGRVPLSARVVVLLLALPVVAVIVPLVEGLWVAMTLRMAVSLGILIVIGLAALLPTLDGLATPNRWWAPTGALLAGGLLIGIGILNAGPSPERPLPSTLVVAVDHGTGTTVWATRDDPGVSWVEESVGPFGEGETGALARFLVPGTYRTAPAPSVFGGASGVFGVPGPPGAPGILPEPAARYEGEVSGALTRTVRIGVVSRAGAELVSIVLDDDGTAGVAAVEGRRVPDGPVGTPGARRALARVTHQGIPRSGDFVVVDIEVADGVDALVLDIVEEHLRPALFLGEELFRRPAHLVPNSGARGDRLLVRTPLVVPLIADAFVEPEGDERPDDAAPADAVPPDIPPTDASPPNAPPPA